MQECDNQWLLKMGITENDAMRLSRELLERCPLNIKGVSRLNYCRDIIAEGSREVKEASHSVSLRKAIKVSLREREGRRPSTLNELRYIFNRFLKTHSRIVDMQLRNIRPNHCYEALETLFKTARQFNKARIILHSIFACGVRHGWCNSNPVDGVLKVCLKEAEISTLPLNQIERLLRIAQRPSHRRCAAVVGLMLWAGVRPAEAQRLQWEDINWDEGVIVMPARHSKTGGARCLTLQPVLRRWLLRVCNGLKRTGSICPKNWNCRWRWLRREAEIRIWQQDVLRHTFASYHLKYFRDLPQLQLEMGHSTPALLRTRYLNMRDITKQQAQLFWSPELWGAR